MFPIVLMAQKKEVTLENIWETYDFYPKSVNGFNVPTFILVFTMGEFL